MSDLPPLREVIAQYGLSARKSLGQNFIFDSQLLDRIAAIPGPLNDVDVYEVGPGPGGLTRALLSAGARVVAVERDSRCLAALADLQNNYPDHLRIIERDALDISLEEVLPEGGHIIANLPYNIGTALLIKWLSDAVWPPRWLSLTLMFQREVADRIVAQPDTRAYGRLAILSQWRSTARIAMKVHRSAFTPPPKVMSAVINIVPKAQPEGVTPSILESLTAAAFSQRRKMLRQCFQKMPGALEAMNILGIDSSRRGETLSIDEYVALARFMTAKCATLRQS